MGEECGDAGSGAGVLDGGEATVLPGTGDVGDTGGWAGEEGVDSVGTDPFGAEAADGRGGGHRLASVTAVGCTTLYMYRVGGRYVCLAPV
jgi:hypothetical protein